MTYAGSIFVLLQYLNQNTGTWLEQSSASIQNAYYNWEYDIKQRQNSAMRREYNRYKALHQESTEPLMTWEDWKITVIAQNDTLFMPIVAKTKSTETKISDITTSSTNQSFFCGEGYAVHNSPRNCYQSAMGKQAMSMFALSHLIRADTSTHVLTYPQKPLVSTKASQMMGFSDMPSGINTVVAIACYQGLTL